MMRVIYLMAILLLLVAVGHADLSNAKTVETIKVEMIQSGTLEVRGNVLKANLTYYIPMQGIKSIDVTSNVEMDWSYINDSFGNRLVLMDWRKPNQDIVYEIRMILENEAVHIRKDKTVGTDNSYLRQTEHIVINDDIRELAFPFEKTMEKATEITQFVFDYMDYDLSYIGDNVPSDVVVEEKKGVCVEHANLGAALMRANGIPTRYVVGYAYSAVQDKLIGHTWLEVLATDGSWIPFDPTWLQAGYLDATHIKSAVFLDNNQVDTLTYVGGDITWIRNDEEFEVLDFTENDVTSIMVTGVDQVASGKYGFVEARIGTDECTIATVKAVSCVDNSLVEQFDITEQTRNFWLCEPETIYWFFKTRGDNYVCPVLVYDQTGSRAQHDVTVKGTSKDEDLIISGPDSILVNQEFAIAASMPGLFYSPDFGVSRSRTWTLTITEPGVYDFYLYLEGNLDKKTITVLEKKEFDLAVDAPSTVNLTHNFTVNVRIGNLLKSQVVRLNIEYAGQTISEDLEMIISDEKEMSHVLQATSEGLNELVVTVSGETLASETILIETPKKEDPVGGFLDGIFEMFTKFFETIALLF